MTSQSSSLASSLEFPFHPVRSWRGVAATLAATLALSSAPGCAAAGPYNPDNLPLGQVSQIGEVCQSVMGVRPGEAHYVGCVESLSDSTHSLNHGRALAQARETCLDKGMRPDTPELARCVLGSTETASAPAVREVSETREAGSAKSYFYASPREAHRRMEMSCATLGFDPASGAFASCVAGLQASLFAADNPLN